jgi:hypothetical protein
VIGVSVLAHVAHWTSWIVYLGPILVVAAWLGLDKLRAGRRERLEPPPGTGR